MRIQQLVQLMGRILFYVFLLLLLILVISALVRELWLTSVFTLGMLIFLIYKGLIRLKIPEKSVVVRDGTVVFFIPETTVRNRFDFISRGQSIVQLPDYGLLDRPFKLEIFFPGSEGRVCTCRLSLRFGYLMQPAAWQRAYDKFVEHQDGLPAAVRIQLMKSCERIVLRPVVIAGDDAMREYLRPVVSALNLELESFGLEVVEVKCSCSEGSSLARFVAAEQEFLEKGLTETAFSWQVREEGGSQKGQWALLGVAGDNVL